MYDLIFVCETWLSNEISDGLLLYKYAYNLACCDRSGNQRGDGVCIFVRNSLQYVIIQILQEFVELGILCVDIIFSAYKQRFIVLYRLPFYNFFEYLNCLIVLNACAMWSTWLLFVVILTSDILIELTKLLLLTYPCMKLPLPPLSLTLALRSDALRSAPATTTL